MPPYRLLTITARKYTDANAEKGHAMTKAMALEIVARP
jgi:hypothetical protein